MYIHKKNLCIYIQVGVLFCIILQVDVEKPDLDAHPLFKEAPYEECILGPGDLLYIPPGCWHYVRSLSVSLSISFWWEIPDDT